MASASEVAPPEALSKMENTNTATATAVAMEDLPELPVQKSMDSTEHGKLKLSLPVIDLAGLASGDPAAKKEIARQVGKAASDFGFFQVLNHGISEEAVNALFRQTLDFFALPAEVKERAGRDPNDVTFGYQNYKSPEDANTVTPWVEFLAQGHYPSPTVETVAEKIWPGGNPIFCNAVHEYTEAAGVLLCQLLELMAESLGLPPDFFSKYFTDANFYRTIWRLHRYEPCPHPSLTVGLRPHADSGVLTILWQNEVCGLQIMKDGKVIDVTPVPGSLVINVGDSLMAWTNGRFQSVEHQAVLNSHVERYSMVYFVFARLDLTIESPPELIDEAHPSLYVPFTGAEYRANVQKLIKSKKVSKLATTQFFLRDRQTGSGNDHANLPPSLR